jgi:hypothetical protein
MIDTRRLMAAAALVALGPATAHAFKVPLPIEGATMSINGTIQTQALITENGTPDGQNPSYDIFARRTRLQVQGDFAKSFTYFLQFDNPNFGKYGNFTNRLYIQDAWFAWAPTGITGGTVFFVEAGIIFVPVARDTITTITNKPTVEGHPDMSRGLGTGYVVSRSTGVGFRGWALDKKIGFRGGVYEGARPSAASPLLNPKSRPTVAAFVNYDILGSEEGGWLYQSIYWAKDPIVSISGSFVHQAGAILGPNGVTDHFSANATLFADYPLSEQQEAVLILAGWRHFNGTNSRDTGNAFAADLGFRYGAFKPYVSYEYFASDDCDGTPGECPVATGPHTADSRNVRFGVVYYINKNLNHVDVEFSLNRGLSSWGAQSVTPLPAGASTNLGNTPSKSLLLHWNVVF